MSSESGDDPVFQEAMAEVEEHLRSRGALTLQEAGAKIARLVGTDAPAIEAEIVPAVTTMPAAAPGKELSVSIRIGDAMIVNDPRFQAAPGPHGTSAALAITSMGKTLVALADGKAKRRAAGGIAGVLARWLDHFRYHASAGCATCTEPMVTVHDVRDVAWGRSTPERMREQGEALLARADHFKEHEAECAVCRGDGTGP